jgi:hypothetical protein
VILHFLVQMIVRSGLHPLVEVGLDPFRLFLREAELTYEGEQVSRAMMVVVLLVAPGRFLRLLPVWPKIVDERTAPLGTWHERNDRNPNPVVCQKSANTK